MSIPSRLATLLPGSRAQGGARWWGGVVPRSSVTDLRPHQIHWLEFGRAERSLILLHGLSASGHWWRRNVPALAEQYRVVIPDLVGFGSSPLTERLPPMSETADLLAAWIRKIGLQRVHLTGHSMGGQIAIHLAVRHPDLLDRLVLVDAAGIPRPLTPRYVLRFAVEMAPLWRWGDPRFFPTMVRDAWTAGPRTVLGAIGHILRDDVRPLLPRIAAPTLVIWGERDGLVPLTHAWQLRRSIPRAELAVLRGASHNPMVDRPADFNRLVMRFLDGARVGR